MQEKSKEIGARVMEMRKISQITDSEMADFLNMPLETYNKYESGEKDIPASVLYEIAHKFKVDLGLLLTGEETRMHIFSVTRKNKGVAVERQKQYKYENLAEKFIHKKAEPFIVTVEPQSKSKKPSTNSHPGQEFNYVLEGSMKIYIHNHEIVLNEGDSIFFDSSYQHAMEALNGKPARFLAMVM
ncbi:cupin domain-containing protein [Methanobacterium alkalithermotolerans]|uniref:Cupin domain-containing protein n=1 Tax=Methanobacterium alkalithermotolerans TaxID=2731220 RepID=A0A8T8K2S2_9EURY|nr:cupin domain-containing protein [Methanobacterium alkalithermotolerans]QUH22768.1 cupin domain-containing protein [Methanobacterium alkalithermotolerans]